MMTSDNALENGTFNCLSLIHVYSSGSLNLTQAHVTFEKRRWDVLFCKLYIEIMVSVALPLNI